MMKMMGAISLGIPPQSLSSSLVENKHTLVFLTLQEAKQSRDIPYNTIVRTLGYYSLNDGGGSFYHVDKNNDNVQPNEGDIVGFYEGRIGIMLDERSINYKMFGAKGDGKNDDGIQIKIAHEYANRHQLTIVNDSGEYWIDEIRGIPIQSSVFWGETIFHINERQNTKMSVFNILSRYESVEIEVDLKIKNKIITAIRPGIQQLPELKEYKNSLIIIVDENDRIGFRAGERYKGQSWAREDFFYLEEGGRVVGDISWTFTDYTSLTAYPAEHNYLIIDGGTFYLSGDNHPEPKKKGYFSNGFSVTRSRTIIKNQWVGLKKGNSDTAFNPRSGFYNFNKVYDVTLENIRLMPWEQNRPGTSRDVYAGTYGISARRMMNSTFRNVTAEGTTLHWGVFGTNLNKNFRIEKCQLNRIDVHFHCWNLTIQDSRIGNRGISITGGGDLIIENTTCTATQFVNFRYDFGAKWEGAIYITNCQLRPHIRTGEINLLRFVSGDFDYRYPIGLAEKIYIRDFIFDFSTVPTNSSECWLMQTSTFSRTRQGERLFFPKNIICDNITVKGRKKGARILKVTSPQTYLLPEEGGNEGGYVNCNSIMHFNNIQLEKMSSNKPVDFHFHITGVEQNEYNQNSLYPRIHFSNCNNLSIDIGGAMSQLFIEHCVVSHLSTGMAKKLIGEVSLFGCKLVPQIFDLELKPYYIETETGASFINCVFYLPRYNETIKPELLEFTDLIKINKSVKHNHVNSRLGRDILEFLDSKSIRLKKGFIRKLQSNYEI